MFKELLDAFRGRAALGEMIDEFDQMLAQSQWMFNQACDVLQRKKPADEVGEALYARDRQINALERSIRRRIIRHLTINPNAQVIGCLAMMAVAKDAERIGDYCKNVFEVAKFHRGELTNQAYLERLETIRRKVESMFDATRVAYVRNDEDRARYVIEQNSLVKDECDAVIQQLLQERDHMSSDEAVAYSLLSRHYKRVAAHLSNICTAVVNPLEMLDYHESAPTEQTG